MPIDLQIKALLFSLFYGAMFAALLRVNYKYMYNGSIIYRIFINFFFVMDGVLLYFIVMKRINEGIVHQYFLLTILLGVVVFELLYKRFKFTFVHKKWYTWFIGW